MYNYMIKYIIRSHCVKYDKKVFCFRKIRKMKFQHIVIFLLATIYSTFSSITLSCFSFPIIDLPSLGFSSSSGIYVQSGVNFLTNVGANTTATVDGCLWGLARYVCVQALPFKH